ncbi:MAG: FAD-dependent oxidoreductase [Ferruginibacter sp.]
MQKNLKRKEFLKITFFANLGLIAKPIQAFSGHFAKYSFPISNDNVIYFKKGDAVYEKLRKGFNKRIEKFPLIIALCKNTTGVAEAVKYARQYNLPVAVKSGGHCMEGLSGNDGGMVINLSSLNTIEWIDKNTIKAGPGCTLSSIYDAVLPKGKILPGGSCAGVGIGGLTLGGGYGLLGRKFGLTCDSLQEITMVDGSGNTRSSANDPELLWACRGGGNGNFGVITEMKFRLSKAPASLQSYRFKSYKVDTIKVKTVLQKWFEVTSNMPTGCFSAFVLNGKTIYILLTNAEHHSTGVQKIIDALSGLTERTTKTTAQKITTALKVFYGRREPLYFKNASAGLYKNFTEIEKCIDKVIDTVLATPGMIYQVNTLGGNIQKEEFEKVSSFPHRAFTYFSELQTYWDTPKQETKLLDKFQLVQTIFSENGIKAQYRNYPDINFINWEEKYYGSNYSRLQQVKRKYDPDNLLRNEQSIRIK